MKGKVKSQDIEGSRYPLMLLRRLLLLYPILTEHPMICLVDCQIYSILLWPRSTTLILSQIVIQGMEGVGLSTIEV